MQPSKVSFKGVKDGIEIHLDEKTSYESLRKELVEKLKQNGSFFKDQDVRITITGKKLSQAQFNGIKRIFVMDYGIRSVYEEEEFDRLREQEEEQRAIAAQKIPFGLKDEYEDDTDSGFMHRFEKESIFIRNTVRSGQRIECPGDIVVIGDVNPGAEVIAGGSIAVFGRLRGLAHAGCEGRKDVCIAAMHMCPKQMRLSGKVVTFPNDRQDVQTAEVAELRGGKVVIRQVKR